MASLLVRMDTSSKAATLPSRVSVSRRGWLSLLIAIALASNVYFFLALYNGPHATKLPVNAENILSKCQALKMKPAPPPGFHQRTVSDRFQPGTPPVLIKNASIWTGRVNGYEVVKGDILLENGIIKAVGDIHHLATGYQDLVVKDVQVYSFQLVSAPSPAESFFRVLGLPLGMICDSDLSELFC
jgi:hypothetical protein